MAFKFSRVARSELDEIVALYAATSVTPGCTWRDGYPGLDLARADLDAGQLYRLADEDGRVVAAGTICLPDDLKEFILPDFKKPCELSRLCTHPSVQGRGVGGELLDRLLEEAQILGYDGAVLLAAVGNTRARRLYTDRRFSETGELHRFDIDFMIMQRAI